jgi:DNA invertase Pin-like site-specific DNA recombinase
MLKAAIYARYSDDKQSDTSIEDQVRCCQALAQRHALCVPEHHIFTDSAITGTELGTQKRTGYQAAIKAWDAREFDILIVDEFSRLSRDPVEQALIMRRLENNNRLRLLTNDGIDTREPDWSLRLGLQGVLAQQESRKIRARVGRGMIGQLERGYMIATPPFGYDFKRAIDSTGRNIGTSWVINEDEAKVVREVFTMREQGSSMHQIAAHLNTLGVPLARKGRTPEGGFWRPSRVRNMLSNAIYRGVFVWHGSTTYRTKANKKGIAIEPVHYQRPELRLVSDETWHRCNGNTHSRTGYGGGKHFLAGLVTCGCCNSTLVLTAPSKERRSLLCATCTTSAQVRSAPQEQLTGTVAITGMTLLLQHALHAFLTPPFVEAFRASLRLRLTGDHSNEIRACKQRLNQLSASSKRLLRMIANASEDDPVLEQEYAQLKEKISKTEKRLVALEAGGAAIDAKAAEAQLRTDPGSLLKELFSAPIPPERLRAVLARLFPSIVFEGKKGRYRSYFRIQFAPGTALAMASDTSVLAHDIVEHRFELSYKPSRHRGEGVWSVSGMD